EQNTSTDEDKTRSDKAWDICADRLKKHDKHMVKAWKEEIDNLLVFAGLVSAILTAFNVETFRSLEPQSETDPTTQTLLHLLEQANPSLNYTTSALPDHLNIPATSSVSINALWFLSLVVSLSAASVAIVLRQWLNHYISPTCPVLMRSAYIYCLRSDFRLMKWRVPGILNLIPILTQLALIFFFCWANRPSMDSQHPSRGHRDNLSHDIDGFQLLCNDCSSHMARMPLQINSSVGILLAPA
ncbi:hypothetical protein CERSUDRAFT_58781, partial [Gelatoporia subvermispora B]